MIAFLVRLTLRVSRGRRARTPVRREPAACRRLQPVVRRLGHLRLLHGATSLVVVARLITSRKLSQVVESRLVIGLDSKADEIISYKERFGPRVVEKADCSLTAPKALFDLPNCFRL